VPLEQYAASREAVIGLCARARTLDELTRLLKTDPIVEARRSAARTELQAIFNLVRAILASRHCLYTCPYGRRSQYADRRTRAPGFPRRSASTPSKARGSHTTNGRHQISPAALWPRPWNILSMKRLTSLKLTDIGL
jgi:hypothetical protein